MTLSMTSTISGWSSVHTLSGYLHHDAVYEIRTKISGQHGNQATYDRNGNIIRSTISAGTADYYSPYRDYMLPIYAEEHRENDVHPFLRALQLDGNPGVPNRRFAPTLINIPCIYQGENLDKYLRYRPPITP